MRAAHEHTPHRKKTQLLQPHGTFGVLAQLLDGTEKLERQGQPSWKGHGFIAEATGEVKGVAQRGQQKHNTVEGHHGGHACVFLIKPLTSQT